MKRAKKRGRKPGVKVGPYKKSTPISLEDYNEKFMKATVSNPGEYPNTIPHKTFNDCIFEITNSMMDQNTKAMAFAAMVEAAKSRIN